MDAKSNATPRTAHRNVVHRAPRAPRADPGPGIALVEATGVVTAASLYRMQYEMLPLLLRSAAVILDLRRSVPTFSAYQLWVHLATSPVSHGRIVPLAIVADAATAEALVPLVLAVAVRLCRPMMVTQDRRAALAWCQEALTLGALPARPAATCCRWKSTWKSTILRA